MSRTKRLRPLFVITLITFGGCIHIFYKVEPKALDPEKPPVSVASPLKVHLFNGGVAVFPNGALFRADSILGLGRRYALDLRRDTAGTPIRGLPLDSVAALETFHDRLRPTESLVVSTLTVGASLIAAAGLAVAIFGSCPTIYSQDDGTARLEAEAFPNSIVPLFEVRDVDRLAASPIDGMLELEVRNEALETHYINHLELLEATHAAGTTAVPDNDGGIWLLDNASPPLAAVDRAGADVTATLSWEDDAVYETATDIIRSASPADVVDYIEIEAKTGGADTAVVFLRLRNSLLSSVFFYEQMLDSQGANALNWMSDDLNSIRGAVQLGGFYQQYMGLRVERLEDGAYREVGRVREVGPIAWDHVAVPVSTEGADTLRLRLRFIADAWRIDRMAVATSARLEQPKIIPLAYARRASGDDARLHARLGRPDEEYVVTDPGNRFWVGFRTTDAEQGTTRTYFIASQGFYTEWVRGDWVRDDVQGEPFEPTVETLHAALQRWIEVKNDFERRFEATKIPVR
jgi:hypothetical protein